MIQRILYHLDSKKSEKFTKQLSGIKNKLNNRGIGQQREMKSLANA